MFDIEMNSYDFLNKVINPARVAAGEKPIRRHSEFMRRHVVPELRLNDDSHDDCKSLKLSAYKICNAGENAENVNRYSLIEVIDAVKGVQLINVVTLNCDEMLLIGMRMSWTVRRTILKLIKDLKARLDAAQEELYMRDMQQLRDEKIHEEVLRTDNSFHTLHIEKKLRMKHGEAIKSYQDDLWNMRESITHYRIRAEQAESRLQNEKEICQMYKQKFLGK